MATETAPAVTAYPEESAGMTPFQQMRWKAMRHPGLLIGGGVVALAILLAIFGPLIAPHDPYAQNLGARLRPPVWSGGEWAYVFGTDQFGRDVFSRLIHGTRISVGIGLAAGILAAIVGTAIGVIGGYYGGRIETFCVYVTNVKLALPGLLVALALVSVFGGSVFVLICVLGFILWERFAVVLRTATKQLRNKEFVTAAKAIGQSDRRIIFREVLPNLVDSIIVIASLEIAIAILAESMLSFLGLGIQPPIPSWGVLVAEGRAFMFIRPSLIVIPGAAIFIVVIAINMLGDGIRDVTSATATGRS